MAYALVGSLGAVSTGASGASITPAYGQSPTAGNLLILWVASDGSGTGISTPTNWSLAKQGGGASSHAGIFYKIAAGADATPTISGLTSSVLNGQLGEFSGNPSRGPDQVGSNATTATSPVTATQTAADIASAELLIICTALVYSASATKTLTLTSNHVTSVTSTTSAAINTASHYALGWGVTNSNSGADTGVCTFTTTNATNVSITTASFPLPSTSGLFEAML